MHEKLKKEKSCCGLFCSCKKEDANNISYLDKALTVTKQKSINRNRHFRNMNDILSAWIEVGNVSLEYICIDETLVNWDARHKLLPFKLCLPDYVNKEYKLTKSSSFKKSFDIKI